MSTVIAVTIVRSSHEIDPTQSRIGFRSRHAMAVKVSGSFDEFAGFGHFDAGNLGQLAAHAGHPAASIETRDADRDARVRPKDFIRYGSPEITFTSTEVEESDRERFRVTADHQQGTSGSQGRRLRVHRSWSA